MTTEPTPTSFAADRKTHTLTVEWDDGKTCIYPFDLLRNACPCAQCRGGHENMNPEPEEDVFIIPLTNVKTTEMVDLTSVGNYAINIVWGDGHKHGIYNWHYLHTLCEQLAEKKN